MNVKNNLFKAELIAQSNIFRSIKPLYELIEQVYSLGFKLQVQQMIAQRIPQKVF
jgi:uncharacterized membrane protein YGL010W